MNGWLHPRNDGWQHVAYDFGLESAAASSELAALLNEACHVFHQHPDGQWASMYKERYASQLAALFQQHPELPGRLLRSGDRVLKMLAYRALKLIAEAALSDERGALPVRR